MRILISADIEGVTGVVDWAHTLPEHREYERFRRLMLSDVAAAARGALENGADDVLITDGHGNKLNLRVEDLPPKTQLISGSPSMYSMMEGAQSGVDGVFFIGYHARAGTAQAILAHTMSSARVLGVWLNGRPAGEFALNAALCGAFGVAPLLISGDEAACAEAREWAPKIQTVAVKRASGFKSAECLHPAHTTAAIEEAAVAAVRALRQKRTDAPLQVKTPVEIIIEFKTPANTDSACESPHAERLDARRVRLNAPDMPTAYRLFRSTVLLAEDNVPKDW